ncbi:MAG: NAD(+)/NADH kinase, partial [Muribaculaceae bacterium]|nr:NAD(+)/NADH kinase [Muribaculaceae bacterium]
MKIAIYGSRRQQPIVGTVSRFLDDLRGRSVEVVMHRKLYDHLRELVPEAVDGFVSPVDGDDFTADLAVSLGGDGTFLRTAVWVGQKQIPIVGVNTGHLGYLAALSVDQLPSLLDFISSDRLRIESRSMLQVTAPELPAGFSPLALNEVAVAKDQNASMIIADVSIGSQPLTEYRADGLLMCTSTGSTAYNLSVGGPIVDPTLEVWVLSPVAAHSLSMRPLVIGSDRPVTI